MMHNGKKAITANYTKTGHKRVTRWNFNAWLKKFDVFAKPLPSFNLKGEVTVPTITGGIFTFFIIIIVMAYGTIKLIHLFE